MKINLGQLKELVDMLLEDGNPDTEIEFVAQPNYPMVVELQREYAVQDNKIQILLTGHTEYATIGDTVDWSL